LVGLCAVLHSTAKPASANLSLDACKGPSFQTHGMTVVAGRKKIKSKSLQMALIEIGAQRDPVVGRGPYRGGGQPAFIATRLGGTSTSGSNELARREGEQRARALGAASPSPRREPRSWPAARHAWRQRSAAVRSASGAGTRSR